MTRWIIRGGESCQQTKNARFSKETSPDWSKKDAFISVIKFQHNVRYEILDAFGILIACMTRASYWLSAYSSVKINHQEKKEGEKSLLEINSPTYKPTNTDTIWVGVRAALLGKTKGHELSAKVFSAWNISFLSTNTFSIEDLIKRVWEFVWGVLGSSTITKALLWSQRVKQHAAEYTAHISVV